MSDIDPRRLALAQTPNRLIRTGLCLLLVWMQVFSAGCGSGATDPTDVVVPPDDSVPEIDIAPFVGSPIQSTTDESGWVGFSSTTAARDTLLTVNLQVQAPGGGVSGMQARYDEGAGKVLIVIDDPLDRYTPALIYATPAELLALDESLLLNDGVTGVVTAGARFERRGLIVLATIFIIVTVVSLAAASIDILRNVVRLQTFFLTDYVKDTGEYVQYCKTWDEVGQLIDAKVSTAVEVGDMLITFVSAAGRPPTPDPVPPRFYDYAVRIAPEFVSGTGGYVARDYRDGMLEEAIEAWGTAMSEIEGQKVGVRVYYEGDSPFRSLRDLYRTISIVRDDPACALDTIAILGVVSDAETGVALSNVRVSLAGPASRVSFTGSQGQYSFSSLPQGDYSVGVSRDGYISESQSVTLGVSPVTVNFVLSRQVTGTRVVLSWGLEPHDLDAHWFGLSHLSHVYYNSPGSLNASPYVQLDLDDLTSFGPETITIGPQADAGTYSVHNYSGSPSLAGCGAVVKIYQGSSLVRTLTVPSSGSGRWWNVANIGANGQIEVVNSIDDSPTNASLDEGALPARKSLLGWQGKW